MDKRIRDSLCFASAGLLAGLLSFSRWGLFSLLSFYPTDLCDRQVAERFFRQGGYINQTIANKIKQDSTVLNCALLSAVQNHSLSSLQSLIDSGADVNAKNSSARTPLFAAKDKEVAQMLIDNGANINAEDSRGMTVLGWRLIQFAHSLNDPNYNYQSREVIETLIENGASVDAETGISENHLVLFIRHAELEGNITNLEKEMLQLLIDSATNVEDSLLFEANHPEIARLLIKNGANVNVKDERGDTLLYLKLLTNEKVVPILIENGANVNDTINSRRNFLFIVKNPETAQLLIDSGVDVNFKDDSGKTPLFFVKDIEVARVLVKNGADVNIRDRRGDTPLHFQLLGEDAPEIAQLLIDSGADVNAKNDYGNTPLFYVDKIETARALIDNGADINAKNNDGKTPLIAVESSLKSAQKNLEEYNSFGSTSFKTELIAYSKQRIKEIKESIEFLVESGGVR